MAKPYKVQRLFKEISRYYRQQEETLRKVCQHAGMAAPPWKRIGSSVYDFAVLCEEGVIDVDKLWEANYFRIRFDIDGIDSNVQKAYDSLHSLRSESDVRDRLLHASDYFEVCALKTKLAEVLLQRPALILTRGAWDTFYTTPGYGPYDVRDFMELDPKGDDARVLAMLEEVRQHLEWVLHIDPAWWRAHMWLGIAFVRMGSYFKGPGYQALRRALMLKPDEPLLWDLAARASLVGGAASETQYLWQKACKLNVYESAMGLGMFLSAIGEPMDAAHCYQIAARCAPRDVAAAAEAEKRFSCLRAQLPFKQQLELLRNDPYDAVAREWHPFKIKCLGAADDCLWERGTEFTLFAVERFAEASSRC